MASSHFAFPSFEKYPYPVEVNVRHFVPTNLSNGNYSGWKTLMLRLIESQCLVGFINGAVSAPPERITVPDDDDNSSINGTKEMENKDYQDWKRSDTLLQRWLIGTINDDVLPDVAYLETAKDIWSKLNTLHERKIGYPLEINVGDFVPIKLSRENYFMWRKLMFRLIERQGFLFFINGECIDGISKDDNAWKRTDQILQSWIMGTIINQDVLACVVDLETAREMWTKLEKLLTFKSSYPRTETSSYPRSETGKVTHLHHICSYPRTETSSYPRSETVEGKEGGGKDLRLYRSLHSATLRGDWYTAKELLKGGDDVVCKDINGHGDTILTVAVRCEKRNHFVKNLLKFMSSDQVVTSTKDDGQTSLHLAAAAGNLEAAKLLMEKNPHLPNISNDSNELPLHNAAQFGRRKMFLHLLDNTREHIELIRPFEGESGATIVRAMILNGLYDIALLLINRFPLAKEIQILGLLQEIAMDNSAFRSGTKFNYWQTLIYLYIPTRLEKSTYHCSGKEKPAGRCIYGLALWLKQKLLGLFWKVTEMIVPWIKHIGEKKRKHYHALELVRCFCMELAKLHSSEAEDIIKNSLIIAVTSGIREIVKEIILEFPEAIYHKNEEDQNLFHIAILNRQKNVFKFICKFTDKHHVRTFFSSRDSSDKTCLDMVARFESEQKLKLKTDAAGAALQMQLELQWFKEVKKLSYLYESKWEYGRKTSEMIFSETHKDLMNEGEKWLKDTANSCTIVAALVVTIVFAAAITVPGGNDGQSGHPILSKDKAFLIFIISDAVALLSSTSSLLMFLSILTSRYAEVDFLYTLPNRLITALITIFISIVSMMVAFGATLYIVFEEKKAWILAPVSAFSIVPVMLFASWQFPLLWDMIKSTYGGGIFGKLIDRLIFL